VISRQPIAPTTTSAAVLAAASATGKNRKPRHTTTTLPSTTTTSPSTTTAPGTPGIDPRGRNLVGQARREAERGKQAGYLE
jgi:hypothetical protein